MCLLTLLSINDRFHLPLQNVSMAAGSLSFPYPSREKARTLKLYDSHSPPVNQARVMLSFISMLSKKSPGVLPFLYST